METARTLPPTKLSVLLAHMDASDWPAAIRLASRFGDLGAERGAILDARMAFTNPRFCRQIGKDPEALIEGGKSALRRRYLGRRSSGNSPR